jgi:hypothetical protein
VGHHGTCNRCRLKSPPRQMAGVLAGRFSGDRTVVEFLQVLDRAEYGGYCLSWSGHLKDATD